MAPNPNSMETAFQYPRGNRLANRVFTDAAAVAEACRRAWDRFAAGAADIELRAASFGGAAQ